MNETKESLVSDDISETSGRVGICRLLPTEAREILTNAAAEASQHEEGSVKRKRIIEVAIDRVRYEWPHFFLHSNHCGQ